MKKIKNKYIYYLSSTVIVFAIMVILSYGHYENTVGIVKSEYQAKIDLIEQSIYNETKYTEIIGKVVDREVKGNMEKNSKAIIDWYNKNPEILEWDFQEMKDQYDQMDIYIINKELEIVASSLQEEVGLTFNVHTEFGRLLKQRLDGNKFETDAINFSRLESELKKYSYMPTPDNQYLIELSINIKDVYPELKDTNIVYLSKNLEETYTFVEEIKVYKYNQYSEEQDSIDITPSKYEHLTKDKNKYIKMALETNESQEYQIIDEHNNPYTLRYIPYTVYYEKNDLDELDWWRSYVIEVVYNDQIIANELSEQRNFFLRNIIILAILYFVFATIIIYLLEMNRATAYKDHLTKLPNRKQFEEVMKYKISVANRKNTKIAVLFLDLDKFKNINDTYGHNVGDKVLQEVANRIKVKIPKGDIVSRLGGDEFTALISQIKSQEEIEAIGKDMLAVFDNPLTINSQEIFIRPSIGISIYPDHGDTIHKLLQRADSAMYLAKEKNIGYKTYQNKP